MKLSDGKIYLQISSWNVETRTYPTKCYKLPLLEFIYQKRLLRLLLEFHIFIGVESYDLNIMHCVI